ncbi:hypothetical protein C8F01DRAFT_1232287 [Mycena amicta]|nr:hypothetical protein C8F01DRAFT_1232287 [Mycena amicta]
MYYDPRNGASEAGPVYASRRGRGGSQTPFSRADWETAVWAKTGEAEDESHCVARRAIRKDFDGGERPAASGQHNLAPKSRRGWACKTSDTSRTGILATTPGLRRCLVRDANPSYEVSFKPRIKHTPSTSTPDFHEDASNPLSNLLLGGACCISPPRRRFGLNLFETLTRPAKIKSGLTMLSSQGLLGARFTGKRVDPRATFKFSTTKTRSSAMVCIADPRFSDYHHELRRKKHSNIIKEHNHGQRKRRWLEEEQSKRDEDLPKILAAACAGRKVLERQSTTSKKENARLASNELPRVVKRRQFASSSTVGLGAGRAEPEPRPFHFSNSASLPSPGSEPHDCVQYLRFTCHAGEIYFCSKGFVHVQNVVVNRLKSKG